MWIKGTKANTTNNSSSVTNLNLLWRSDRLPIYFMDNHLAAAWCWMQECDPTERYNFIHIDRHNDLGPTAPYSCYQHLKDNPRIPIDDYLNIRNPNQTDFDWPAFTWDNYINQTIQLFPDWFLKCIYATHRQLDSRERRMNLGCCVIEESLPFNLPAFLHNTLSVDLFDEIKSSAGGHQIPKWIVNLDLDYLFYTDLDEKNKRLLTDEFIKEISSVLKLHMDRIAVLTVALSPECCGGWEQALDAAFVFIQNESFIEECEEFIDDTNLFPSRRKDV